MHCFSELDGMVPIWCAQDCLNYWWLCFALLKKYCPCCANLVLNCFQVLWWTPLVTSGGRYGSIKHTLLSCWRSWLSGEWSVISHHVDMRKAFLSRGFLTFGVFHCLCQNKCHQYWPKNINEKMDLRYDLHLTLVEQRAYVEYKLKRMVLVNVILRTTQSVKDGKKCVLCFDGFACVCACVSGESEKWFSKIKPYVGVNVKQNFCSLFMLV